MKNYGPADHVSNFGRSFATSSSKKRKEEKKSLPRVYKFSPLPVEGWNDKNGILDFKCKQSCVKDCSCVTYCILF